MNLIKQRHSIRTFTGEKLKQEHKSLIREYLDDDTNLIGINGNKIRIKLKENKDSLGGKIGTYGFIKNAPAYLVIISKNDKDNMLDVGYVFEKMVIFLTALGIGTCWMAGTFKRKQFSVDIKDGDIIPAISPVGYSNKKRSLTEKAVRAGAKADTRIDFDELFFQDDFNTVIQKENIRNILEDVRLAPSASNKQPWRVVVEDNVAHFYILRTPNYGGLGFDIQWLDIGIALAHYEIASSKTEFFITKPTISLLSGQCEYVISVK